MLGRRAAVMGLSILTLRCASTDDALPLAPPNVTGGAGSPSTNGGASSGSGGVAGAIVDSGGAGGSVSAGATSSGGAAVGGGGSTATEGGVSGGGAGGTSGGGKAGSGTACDGHLLCDDFETYDTGAAPTAPWIITKNGSGTSLVIDALQHRSGQKSAHFSGSLNASNSVHMSLKGAPVFPVAGNTLFVRFSMYVGTYPGSKNEEMHTRLVWVGFDDMALNTSGAGINSNNNQVYAMETYNGIGVERLSSGHYRDTSLRMPQAPHVGKWVCWELEIDNAGGPPAGVKGGALTHLWRDGSELKLAVKGGESETWGPVPFEMLNFSFFAYQTASEPSDFWIDDVALDTERIGCPAQ